MGHGGLHRLATVLIAIAGLSACGSYRTAVLYEPSTKSKAATFIPGDGCTKTRYLFGTVSSSGNAMVFLNVAGGEDLPSCTYQL